MEIGSEFDWCSSLLENSKTYIEDDKLNRCILTFSGRTAIEVVLNNISDAKKAILPSYCCDSMIEPFRKAGIDVCFYDVYYDEGLVIDLIVPEDVNILLWCNYFGYKTKMPDVSEFKQRGGIVIEDITHSLLSDNKYDSQSDYLVASLRKWIPVLCGGYCESVNGILKKKPETYPSEVFLNEKKKAMELKHEYLFDNDEQKKIIYLSLFSDTNEWLSNNYSNLMIDNESIQIISRINFDYIKQSRIENAKTIYEGLENSKLVKPLFSQELMECPLFVPVIVQNEKRDLIKKKLIENDIYCPVHWPKPFERPSSNIYELELSLVCDQRYTQNDMNRITYIIDNI